MAQYLMLIYDDEAAYEADKERIGAAHAAFGEKNAGAIRGGAHLHPAATATSIRDGAITDGPFAETKEVLGGFYLLEAEDLDAAVAMAREIPTGSGGVEVRPVIDYSA
jgi:hypothetical protein